ncbi:MAG: nucleotidyltransferase domain-containing protein, partial [bacterium]
MRLLLERSRAIKCPNIADHLAGSKKIQQVLAGFPEVEKAVLYGSRAKGNYKPGSDIDLTLFGEELDERVMSRLYWALDDLLLP